MREELPAWRHTETSSLAKKLEAVQEERKNLDGTINKLKKDLGKLINQEEAWKETLAVTGLDHSKRDEKEVIQALSLFYDALIATRAALEHANKQMTELVQLQAALNERHLEGGTQVGEA